MKNLNILNLVCIAFLAGFISIQSTFAAGPLTNNAETLNKIISEKIIVPQDEFKKCCEGTADVIFVVDEQGKIDVKKVLSNDGVFAERVKEQFSKIDCKEVRFPYNQHFRIKLTVTLI